MSDAAPPLTPDAHAYEVLRVAGYPPARILPGRPVNTRRGGRFAYSLDGVPSKPANEPQMRKAGYVLGYSESTLWVKQDTDLAELNRCLGLLGAPPLDAAQVAPLVAQAEAVIAKVRAGVLPRWRSFLERPQDVAIVDSETTGLDDPELCSLAIIRTDGTVLFNELIMPQGDFDSGATRAHGHTRESLAAAGAKPFDAVHRELHGVLSGLKGLLAWNARFDAAVVEGAALRRSLPMPPTPWHCVMRDWSLLHPDRRFRLQDAMQEAGVKRAQAHSALDDCRAVLEVMRVVTGTAPPTALSVRIPYPVSVNAMFQVRGNRDKGGPAVALTKEYKAFRDQVRAALGDDYVRFAAEDRLSLNVTLHPSNKGNVQDASNGVKAIEDALQKWEVYPDDKAICEVWVRRDAPVDGDGYADVQVKVLA